MHSNHHFIGNEKNLEENKTTRQPSREDPESVLNALLDYRVTPLMADNEKGLPKTLLVNGEFDILRDDIVLYRKHLEKDGVDVSHYENKSHHAFLMFETVRSISDAAFDDVIKFLKSI